MIEDALMNDVDAENAREIYFRYRICGCPQDAAITLIASDYTRRCYQQWTFGSNLPHPSRWQNIDHIAKYLQSVQRARAPPSLKAFLLKVAPICQRDNIMTMGDLVKKRYSGGQPVLLDEQIYDMIQSAGEKRDGAKCAEWERLLQTG